MFEIANFAGRIDNNMRVVIKIAEDKHQIQVAPITKGSRKVRYIENNVPDVVMISKAKPEMFVSRPLE